jgi:hypothetical protein
MRTTATITLTTATYNTHDDAVRDFDDTWSARRDGRLRHTATAVLTPDPHGSLRVERSRSTARHLAWGGALLGGGLFLVAPAAGAGILSSAGLNGAGVFIAHFHDHLRPEDIARSARLLKQEPCAVFVVLVVDDEGEEATSLLPRARTAASMVLPWGELDEELDWDQLNRRLDTVLVPT